MEKRICFDFPEGVEKKLRESCNELLSLGDIDLNILYQQLFSQEPTNLDLEAFKSVLKEMGNQELWGNIDLSKVGRRG